jgi:hypothetical protein
MLILFPVYSERPILISGSIIQHWKGECDKLDQHDKPDRLAQSNLPMRNIVVLLNFPSTMSIPLWLMGWDYSTRSAIFSLVQFSFSTTQTG